MHESSPLGTPTTPRTPAFSLLPPSPTSSPGRRRSLDPTATVIPAPSSSTSALPLSPVAADPTHSIPTTRALPLRAAAAAAAAALPSPSTSGPTHQVSQPSPQHQQQARGRQRQRQRRRRRRLRFSPATSPGRIVPPGAPRPILLTYATAVSRLSTTLLPLVSVTTGLPHPAFPRSLLEYHLLTHAQLDALAVYYHQVSPPVRETSQYPVAIPAWLDRNGETVGCGGGGGGGLAVAVALETKRRRWGRFLGLRGCESPRGDDDDPHPPPPPWDGPEEEEEREFADRLEREWTRGVQRNRDEERLRQKAEGWRERW